MLFRSRVLSPTNIFTQSNVVANLIRAVNFQSNLSSNSLLVSNINFVQKAQASLLATGTTTADLTVGSSVDADAAAFFARVTAAGGTLTTTEQNAVNTLVVQMKADGIWTKMKAIYPMVGASAAACAQNLKSSSFTGTFYGANTFNSNGLITNGTNSAMGTNLRPSESLNLYSNHISVYNKSSGAKNYVLGCYDDGGGQTKALSIQGLTTYIGRNCLPTISTAGITVNVLNSLGFYLNRRLSNIEMSLFKNSIKLLTNTTTAATIQPRAGLVIGATSYNNGITPNFGYSSTICSFVSIGDGLDDTEAVNLYTVVQAFQTTLNRQEL